MNLSEEEVRAVADLANLRLSEEEVARMQRDLAQILTHAEQLSQLDTTGVEPMTQVFYGGDETSTLREDVPHTPLSTAEALSNSELTGAGSFKVPKVFER